MTNLRRPGVGLGIILMNFENSTVLLGKRKNSHGAGTWSFPGGHLEWMERLWDCANREMDEETGLMQFFNYEFMDENSVTSTNDFFEKEDKHYITLYLRAKWIYGKPKIMEQDKCEEWKWYNWKKLPKINLFTPVKNLIKAGYNPFAK